MDEIADKIKVGNVSAAQGDNIMVQGSDVILKKWRRNMIYQITDKTYK